MMSQAMAAALIGGGRRPAPALTVLYDERCPLCRKLKAWLAGQASLAAFAFVPAGSAEARRRFPALDHERTITVLTVVGPDGAFYEGERAWLVCAWALPQWRQVAEHFGTRTRLPFVRIASRTVDAYRHRLIARSYGQPCGTDSTSDCRITAPR